MSLQATTTAIPPTTLHGATNAHINPTTPPPVISLKTKGAQVLMITFEKK